MRERKRERERIGMQTVKLSVCDVINDLGTQKIWNVPATWKNSEKREMWKEKDRGEILDPLHHTGVQLCSGAFSTGPTPDILAPAGEPPLTIRRQILNLTYCTTLLKKLTHPNLRLDGQPSESVFTRELADLVAFNLAQLFTIENTLNDKAGCL